MYVLFLYNGTKYEICRFNRTWLMDNCYTSTKSWRGYIFTSVCLSVCLSVCVSVCVSVNKIPAERTRRFGRVFTPPRNRGGVMFLLQFVCLCVCVSICLWTKCRSNRYTNFDAIFVRSLRYICSLLARTLGELGSKVKVTVTQNPFFVILCYLPFVDL